MPEVRVIDTSPLIYLARAGLLELLQLNAERVVVPQGVVDEIVGWPTAEAAEKSLHLFEVIPPETISPSIAAWDLGKGESTVLAYGLNIQAVR